MAERCAPHGGAANLGRVNRAPIGSPSRMTSFLANGAVANRPETVNDFVLISEHDIPIERRRDRLSAAFLERSLALVE